MRLASLAVVLIAAPLFAQDPVLPVLPPTIGSRVRIQADTLGREPVVVILNAVTRDSISVRTIVPYRMRDMQAVETIAIPRSAVRELDAHIGSRRHALKGAGVGALTGGALLGVVAGLTFEPCESKELFGCGFFGPKSTGEAFGWGAAVGTAYGALIGALVGAFVSTDKWGRVEVSALSALHVAPRANGVALSMSLK